MNHEDRKAHRIYLDYAAATPLDPYVLRVMLPFLERWYGNPSSIHAEGRKAREAVEKARAIIARVLHTQPRNILFTGSGTESAALALCGIMRSFPKSAHLVTTSLEHAAVLENARMLECEGYQVTYVRAAEDGCVSEEAIASAIKPETVLVSVIYVHNEMGAIQPLQRIASVIRKERTQRKIVQNTTPLYFHTDACQAAGLFSINVEILGVDFLTLNASKLYGPKGVGALYVRNGVALCMLWQGGGQEQGLRSGTENVGGIIGFAAALEQVDKQKQKERVRLARLQKHFIATLHHMVPEAILNGPSLGEYRTPNNIHITIPDIMAETLVLYLDAKGVAASTGSACSTNRDILAPGGFAKGGIRFTMGRSTTRRDIDYTVRVLWECIQLLKKAPKLETRN